MPLTVVYDKVSGKGLFDGTNGTALPTYDATWTNPSGVSFNDCVIRGTPGMGAAGASSEAILSGAALNNDQYCQITLDQTHFADTHFFLRIRGQNDGTTHGYSAGYNPEVHIDRRYCILKDGVEQSNSGATVAAGGDVLLLQAVGSTITLTVNQTVLLTLTDSTYTSGFSGISADDRSGLAPRLAGSFSAGNVTSVGAAQLTPAFTQASSSPGWYSSYV